MTAIKQTSITTQKDLGMAGDTLIAGPRLSKMLSTLRLFLNWLATRRRTCSPLLWVLIAATCLLPHSASDAQEVTAQISTREAWVGSPVVFQIQITNANDYSLPESIKVDGCDVRSAGTPSKSSQITIFNGRRSETRGVTAQYLITPKREGRFQIPALEIQVDDQPQKTRPISFVATKSETGDLLFIEVEGKKESVFVGESLDIKLKIWIKPYADREKRIKLEKGHMWQLISEQTSWGSFTDRLQEFAENRERPRGKTVLRSDRNGNEREYYLYEIDATVYPIKPGKIDASDLQVVLNYPLELGRSRDPFDRFFENSPFGGGRRLTVSDTRPVSAKATVSSTTVLPIPTAKQPRDYRGAVGRYKIITKADPPNVASGDPITLQIGIVGNGSMELVQAPPLHDLGNLTSNFQVTDQSLAGFVQDDTKVFVTTIRPRNEDVTEIPAIPFSFFDPEKQAYETVFSQPINIVVEKAETLGLDAIVSNANSSMRTNSKEYASNESADALSTLDFTNTYTANVLSPEPPPSRTWWWYFAILPPVGWLAIVVSKLTRTTITGVSSLRSPRAIALAKSKSAKEASNLTEALRNFVDSKLKSDCPTTKHAVGEIRNLGAYDDASVLESLFDKLEKSGRMSAIENTNLATAELAELKNETVQLINQLEQTIQRTRRGSRVHKKRSTHASRRNLTASIVGFLVMNLHTACFAIDQEMVKEQTAQLNYAQLETTLKEANESYRAGLQLMESEPAKATSSFAVAASRYQTLVDEGIRNSNLFCNLGNASQKSGDTTNAILNYHRALWINPRHTTATRNLAAIQQQQIKLNSSKENRDESQSLNFDWTNFSIARSSYRRWIDHRLMQILFAVSSVTFWMLLILKTVRPKQSFLRWAILPLLFTIVTGWSLFGLNSVGADAIITADSIELKFGDGDEFDTCQAVKSTAGQLVSVIAERDAWFKVQMRDGMEGWLPASQLAIVQIEPDYQ